MCRRRGGGGGGRSSSTQSDACRVRRGLEQQNKTTGGITFPRSEPTALASAPPPSATTKHGSAMASAQDVRDILDLPAEGTSATAHASVTASSGIAAPPTARVRPRVDGITRELYALLGSNAPSLALASEHRPGPKPGSKKYNPRLRNEIRSRLNHHWAATPFRNPARRDGLVLSHWSRHPAPAEGEEAQAPVEEPGTYMIFCYLVQYTDVLEEYRFSSFNTSSGVYSYSNDEYSAHLRDDAWSKEETDYLMDIAAEYDLRWPVIWDRYDWAANAAAYLGNTIVAKPRSSEDLQARYYAVCRRLIRSRISVDDTASRQRLLERYAYDARAEAARRAAVAALYARAPEALAEEEALYIEARRIEQQQARFASDREDLLRLLGGWERLSDATPASIAAAGAGIEVSPEPVRKKRRTDGAGDAAAPAVENGTTTASGATKPETGTNESASLLPPEAVNTENPSETIDAAFDEKHYIQRFDPAQAPPSRGPYPLLTGTPSTQPPLGTGAGHSHGAYVRSSRILVPRTNLAPRTAAVLAALDTPPMTAQRLVFPTARNVEKWEGLLGAITTALELKKNLDRAANELNTLRLRANGPPQAAPTTAEQQQPSALS